MTPVSRLPVVFLAVAAAQLAASAAPVLPGYLTDPSVLKDQMPEDESYQPPERLKYPYISTYYVKPTVTTDDAEMKIYFDGDAEPRYVCTVRGFFNGAIPELVSNANTFLERGQWAYGDPYCGNFFIPIPYEKGIKISTRESIGEH